MIGSITECRFYSIGEFGEIIYTELQDTLRYTSFKNNSWVSLTDTDTGADADQWIPVTEQDVKKIFVEFIIRLCTDEIANLNMKYFSYVGDYEKQRMCEKIQKMQSVLNNVKQNREKYGDSIISECRSYFHYLEKDNTE